MSLEHKICRECGIRYLWAPGSHLSLCPSHTPETKAALAAARLEEKPARHDEGEGLAARLRKRGTTREFMGDDASDGYGDQGWVEKHDPLMEEAATAIESLSARNKELVDGLGEIAADLTCRGSAHSHYCPNCDRSLFETLRRARSLTE
jgi:hypothetical protein